MTSVTASTHFANTIEKLANELPAVGNALPTAELNEAREMISQGLRSSLSKFVEIGNDIERLSAGVKSVLDRSSQLISAHVSAYQSAASEDQILKSKLASLKSVAEDIEKHQRERDNLTSKIEAVGDADLELSAARTNWLETIRRKRQLFEQQAGVLTATTRGQLRVSVGQSRNGKDSS